MTRLLFTKLFRDLRAARTRIVLMVVAVSISLVVFSAVLYARSIMDREISRSYTATDPASATVLLDRGVDADQAAALSAAARTRPGIVDATLRTQFTARIQMGSGQGSANPLQAFSANPLQLFVAAPDDPMRIANFEVEQGTWPPPAGGILIERAALEFLNLKVGDTIVVKTPDGRPAPMKVTGIVHDPSLSPAGQEQKGYGYISSAALPLLGERPVLRELKIVVAGRPGQTTPSPDRDAIVATAGGLGTWLEQTRGVRVNEIQVPPPYEHPHQGQMNAILLALLSLAACRCCSAPSWSPPC